MQSHSSKLKRYSKIALTLTGFPAFGKVKHNPSEQVVENFKSQKTQIETGKTKIAQTEIIEVSCKQIDMALTKLYSGMKTEKDTLNLFIFYGYDETVNSISLETQAFNKIMEMAEETKILESGPDCIKGRLPLNDIVKKIQGKGIKCSLSEDPGNYVCNYIFYQSLIHFGGNENAASLFIHVPMLNVISLKDHVNFIKNFIQCVEEKLCTK